ncbi:MAG: putative DNA-binding domain-containing protein [Pontibacterium sp.]
MQQDKPSIMTVPRALGEKTKAYESALSDFSQAVLSGHSGFEAYTYNYLAGHAAALDNIFLSVKACLGDVAFSALGGVYVAHYPATVWDLNRYGESFSSFLAAQAHGPKANDFNWLAISLLAKIEFGVTEQYYAELDIHRGGEATVIEDEHLVKLDAELCGLLAKHHPYLSISEEPVDGQVSVSLPVAIWRDHLTIRMVSLGTLGVEEEKT